MSRSSSGVCLEGEVWEAEVDAEGCWGAEVEDLGWIMLAAVDASDVESAAVGCEASAVRRVCEEEVVVVVADILVATQ
jgi:hypothetical protein